MAFLALETPRKTGRFLLPAFVFGATLCVYLLTLCPTVYVGDSAEFITNAVTLGINHPTGYPLYTVLGRLIVLLMPFWAPAATVNLLSAIAASLSAVCLYLIIQMLTSRKDVAVLTALLFGFSHTLWSRATTAEVYALNALCIAASLLFLLRWYHRADNRDILLTAYLVGFGLSQHVTGVLVAISIAAFVLLTRPRIVLNARLMLLLGGFALLGFTTYLYLPIRSAANPPLDWGNPETVGNLLSLIYPVGQKGLGAFFGSQDEERLSWILNQALAKEFWYFGGVALLGIALVARQWRLLILLLTIVLLDVAFTISRKLPLHADFDAYFIPSYLVMAILAGIAISSVVKWLESRWELLHGTKFKNAIPALLLLLPITCLVFNYHENDKSGNYLGYDFGVNVLSPLEKNAILFTIGDEQTFLGWYFKYLEESRPDIAVVDVRLLGTPWGASQMLDRELHLSVRERRLPEDLGRQIINTFLGQRPIYFTHRLPWDFLLKDYDMVHVGMLIQILPKGSPVEYRPSNFVFHAGWEKAFFDERCKLLVNFYPKEYTDNAQFWLNRQNTEAAQNELNGFFAFPHPKQMDDRVTGYLVQSLILGQERRTREAIAFADSAIALNPADWRAYEYRGNFNFLVGDSVRAFSDWKKSLEFNPSNQTVRRNIEAVTRLQQLRALTPPVRRR